MIRRKLVVERQLNGALLAMDEGGDVREYPDRDAVVAYLRRRDRADSDRTGDSVATVIEWRLG